MTILRGKAPVYFVKTKENNQIGILRYLSINLLNQLRKIINRDILISDVYISKMNLLKFICKTGFLPYFNQELNLKISNNSWNIFVSKLSYRKK